MYIHHAENLMEGRPYSETGYIYNPAVPVYGPKSYPPVFPILLTPLYKFSGLKLMPMKVQQVIFFLLTLMLVFALWHRELGTAHTLTLICILGFSPVFWAAKDSVLSDLPFLMFFYLAAFLVERAPRAIKNWWFWAALVGLTLYLAIGTRTAGIALIAGVVLCDLYRYRRVRRFTGVAFVVCATFLLIQIRLIGAVSGSYFEQVRLITVRTVLANFVEYTRVLAGFWVASVRGFFSFFVLAIVALLAIAGFLTRAKRGFTATEAVLLSYLGVILAWPFAAGVRIAFPFVPWVGFLVLMGLRELGSRFVPRKARVLPGALVVMIAVPFIQAYRSIDFGPIQGNMSVPEFNLLCEAVSRTTAPQEVFVYYRARSLSLYTGRSASTYNPRGTQEELSRYTQKIHATYLVTTNAFADDSGFLAQYAQTHSKDLDLIYQNPHFSLYRILSVAESRTTSLSR